MPERKGGETRRSRTDRQTDLPPSLLSQSPTLFLCCLKPHSCKSQFSFSPIHRCLDKGLVGGFGRGETGRPGCAQLNRPSQARPGQSRKREKTTNTIFWAGSVPAAAAAAALRLLGYLASVSGVRLIGARREVA